jgi:hypothetical protein
MIIDPFVNAFDLNITMQMMAVAAGMNIWTANVTVHRFEGTADMGPATR